MPCVANTSGISRIALKLDSVLNQVSNAEIGTKGFFEKASIKKAPVPGAEFSLPSNLIHDSSKINTRLIFLLFRL